ncbi:uncharacterized protein LOC114320089 [Camellia sinensis]|uniref:uncharacterized protein LOC114320089 n=1 Tax=Camellia sinensis TaxID=4442 RepID=UPI001036A09B|nr:uncharacterized protein LOC114320089 [Camellia sinensis]
MVVIDRDGKIFCPCRKCVNVIRPNFQIVQIHLLQHGIIPTYTIWHVHREPRESNEAYHHDIPVECNEVLGGIDALVEDQIRGESTNTTQEEEVRTFDKLLNDAKCEVYPSCTNYTLLKFVIEILNTKGNATLDKCPICKASRYKTNHGRGKKIFRKVLRYFPLTLRLKRLYMSRKRAEDMKWFKEKRLDDSVLSHPADSDEWKKFDTHHPKFALEPRNVRLGLATDGFNPFGNMNNSYSLWPVVLIPYNLPPWLAIKDPFFTLSLLIPGESQPGIDIDVYMRPLVEELNELWKNGTLTYDASTGETFCMRATLLWTIHDWLAFGDISGWRTKGHYSCYTCNDEPYFESLSSKTAYSNHRCYLPDDHPEMRKSRAYNGKHEKWKRSLVILTEKIEEQLGSMTGVTYGKHPSNMKRPRQNPNWTKVSILYELPYWKKRRL